ncbi:RidA family protein [Amycolatopsis thermoflava]|uniref:RidA family protein n=1 Tax=Amycolatopsis thermoflava TaxID=84480 RepID=UPI003EBF4426
MDARSDGHTENFSPYARAGDFVFVSGQAAVDESGKIVGGTFEEQMRLSVENVCAVLASAGLALSDVVRVGAYVQDLEDIEQYNRIYPEYFRPPRPARTTITNCLGGSVKFEIDVVAFAPSGRSSPAGGAE